jgi:phosphoenolpyruvate synthase/pyruvate phosphate dikinase
MSVVSLDAADLAVGTVGGKAYQLSLLRTIAREAAGTALGPAFHVPQGCVVTTAAFQAHVLAGLGPDALALSPGVGKDHLAAIRARVLGLTLSEDVRAALGAFLAGVVAEEPSARFAVRSSGVSEDSSAASFAGGLGLWGCGAVGRRRGGAAASLLGPC